MNDADFQLRAITDPRIAVYATSPLPAWLWSVDGKQIKWANPVGATLFGAASAASLAERTIGPADAQRRQVAQLAGRLSPAGTVRLERLRGFGATPGMLATCGCARLAFADGSTGILITATQATGRKMPLIERLQQLVEDVAAPVAAFSREGLFVGASDTARPLFKFRSLAEIGLDVASREALQVGRAETSLAIGNLVLQRVGRGEDVGLLALLSPAESAPADVESTAPAAPDDVDSSATAAPAERALSDTAPEPASAPSEASAGLAMTDAVDVTASAAADITPAPPEPVDDTVTAAVEARSWRNERSPVSRRHPLRFMWQMDADGRFSLGSDEFARLIGARTAAGFGRPWRDIAEEFGLDPDGRVSEAVATRNTWSGVTVNWPVDGGGRLPVELSGLPIYDRRRNFAGFRGFGVCRDLDSLSRLMALRRFELFGHSTRPLAVPPAGVPPALPISPDPPLPPQPGVRAADAPADAVPTTPADEPPEPPEPPPAPLSAAPPSTGPSAVESPPPTDPAMQLETPLETPKNVLPFRPLNEPKPPMLTPVENNAFAELARQLSARLDTDRIAATSGTTAAATRGAPAEQPTPAEAEDESASARPDWMNQPEPAPRGETQRDKILLDLLPVGVLIYRLDRLLYANAAFLARMGYLSLNDLEQAGGVDALYVEPGVSSASSTSDTGTPVTISISQARSDGGAPAPAGARLYTISWDDDSALALIFSGTGADNSVEVLPVEALPAAAIAPEAETASEPASVGRANAEELAAILDTTAEGIVIFDAEGNIKSCNRSAEALFGYDSAEITHHHLTDLFAPESQPLVRDYLHSVKSADIASLLEHGRELLGRVREGGLIPLSLTIGRARQDGGNLFAVFRDLSQSKKNESELQQVRRQANRAATAKSDLLARISHEVRAPLNAIIGFADVMIGERFGALGNERYVDYMKDIRASGERVVAIISDLLDLSRIETGRLDLNFTRQNLNDLVEQCVAGMQPQANRERIIIRTSLAHMLPAVTADGAALRQIALNLIGTSIHLAKAGGQVIVSTALSDLGEVVLRVRDTGPGLNEKEVAAAMEPFRTQAPSDQTSEGSAVNLSLTKALVEANRAQFRIKTGPHSGTLIEVVFSHAMART